MELFKVIRPRPPLILVSEMDQLDAFVGGNKEKRDKLKTAKASLAKVEQGETPNRPRLQRHSRLTINAFSCFVNGYLNSACYSVALRGAEAISDRFQIALKMEVDPNDDEGYGGGEHDI